MMLRGVVTYAGENRYNRQTDTGSHFSRVDRRLALPIQVRDKPAVSSLTGLVILATIMAPTVLFRPIRASQKEPVLTKDRQDGPKPPARVKDEEQAPAAFVDSYRLAPAQNLKRINPPRPPGFAVWYKTAGPGRGYGGGAPEYDAMVFNWSATNELRLSWHMMGNPQGSTIRELPTLLKMGLRSYEIDGDPELLNTELDGDWIVRDGVAPEDLVKPLQAILQRAVRLRITVALRRVEREVVVARGRYRASPLPGHAEGQIEVYAREVAQDHGWGSGNASFPGFLENLAEWFRRPVFNEVESAPKGMIQWRHNERRGSEEEAQRRDGDLTLILRHLEEQTGLTFAHEKRPVRVLFVERPAIKK
jgi:hypothetical protein